MSIQKLCFAEPNTHFSVSRNRKGRFHTCKQLIHSLRTQECIRCIQTCEVPVSRSATKHPEIARRSENDQNLQTWKMHVRYGYETYVQRNTSLSRLKLQDPQLSERKDQGQSVLIHTFVQFYPSHPNNVPEHFHRVASQVQRVDFAHIDFEHDITICFSGQDPKNRLIGDLVVARRLELPAVDLFAFYEYYEYRKRIFHISFLLYDYSCVYLHSLRLSLY
mmetsp:Transcript_19837/g.29664  ORF Transcript_19837/g.29664 Transcript_19837/m.29664 type:complete len:220 (-) Transcript_19837:2259-2918(-)